eukprot:jgi/Mesvir1/4963/Mv11452-RA.1
MKMKFTGIPAVNPAGSMDEHGRNSRTQGYQRCSAVRAGSFAAKLSQAKQVPERLWQVQDSGLTPPAEFFTLPRGRISLHGAKFELEFAAMRAKWFSQSFRGIILLLLTTVIFRVDSASLLLASRAYLTPTAPRVYIPGPPFDLVCAARRSYRPSSCCDDPRCDHDHRPANSSQFASTAAVFYGSSRTIRSFIPAEPVSDWEREVRRVRQASKVWPSGFIRPVEKQWVVSSGFGSRWGRFHNGVDLAAPMGAPILAADSGTVTYAAYEPRGYGHIVEVTHSDGWQTLYAHSQRIFPRVGDKVERGECIATVGCSGRVTGPHLHWEIRDPSGKPVDPSLFCHDLH